MYATLRETIRGVLGSILKLGVSNSFSFKRCRALFSAVIPHLRWHYCWTNRKKLTEKLQLWADVLSCTQIKIFFDFTSNDLKTWSLLFKMLFWKFSCIFLVCAFARLHVCARVRACVHVYMCVWVNRYIVYLWTHAHMYIRIQQRGFRA